MRQPPEYRTGDYLIIYSGSDEGLCFTVKNYEWRKGTIYYKPMWWYDTGSYGWKPQNLVCTERYFRAFG